MESLAEGGLTSCQVWKSIIRNIITEWLWWVFLCTAEGICQGDGSFETGNLLSAINT